MLAFIFVLGLIIAVHEFGHFFFARSQHSLPEFAFGMGPILWKKKKAKPFIRCAPFRSVGFAPSQAGFEGDPLKKAGA